MSKVIVISAKSVIIEDPNGIISLMKTTTWVDESYEDYKLFADLHYSTVEQPCHYWADNDIKVFVVHDLSSNPSPDIRIKWRHMLKSVFLSDKNDELLMILHDSDIIKDHKKHFFLLNDDSGVNCPVFGFMHKKPDMIGRIVMQDKDKNLSDEENLRQWVQRFLSVIPLVRQHHILEEFYSLGRDLEEVYQNEIRTLFPNWNELLVMSRSTFQDMVDQIKRQIDAKIIQM